MRFNRDKRLCMLCARDGEHNELAEELSAITKDYMEMMKSLPREQFSILARYIYVCAQIDYRRVELAYIMGKQDGRSDGFVFF